MLQYLEQVIFVLAVGSAVAIAAKRIAVPYNVALVVVGLLLVLMDVLPQTPMDPEIVLMVFLPILVFQSALSTDARSMRQSARPILTLALPGVAVSLFGTAVIVTWAIGLPFNLALLLGAILSITDTVSVLLAFRSVRVPHRLSAIMEGESLFNDGTALVLVSVTATAALSGLSGPVQTIRLLFVAIMAGALIGAAFGIIGSAILKRAPDDLTAILASLVLVFATSLAAETLRGSAVIAVVILGVLLANEMHSRLEASRVLAMESFWEIVGFVSNVWLFLLVGMQLRAELLLQEAVPIVLALIALHVGRAIAVYGCFAVLRSTGRGKVPLRWQHVMVIGNVKGALSMAAVLSVPEGIPNRDRLVAIVFGVTLVTLVTQALPFRRILAWLKVGGTSRDALVDQSKATLIGARRGQSELDGLLAAGMVSRRVHAERWAAFQREIIDAEHTLHAHRQTMNQDHMAEHAVLLARKAAILDAAHRGLISDNAANKCVTSLDEEFVRSRKTEDET